MFREKVRPIKKSPEEIRAISEKLVVDALLPKKLARFLFITEAPISREMKDALKQRFLTLLPYLVTAFEERSPSASAEGLYERMRELITHDLLHAAVSMKRGKEIPVPLFVTEKKQINNPELIQEELYAVLSYHPVAKALIRRGTFEDATKQFFKHALEVMHDTNFREFDRACRSSPEEAQAFKEEFFRAWAKVKSSLEPEFKQLMREIYDEAHQDPPRYDRMARFLLEETKGVQPLFSENVSAH